MRKLVIILLLATAVQSQAAMSLLFREMFDTTGTLTSGSPGSNFTSVTGTLYQRAGGPRLISGSAASADPHGTTAYGTLTLPAYPSQTDWLVAGGWFFFASIGNSGANATPLILFTDHFGNTYTMVDVSAGIIRLNAVTLPVASTNQWVYLAVATHFTSNPSGGTFNYDVRWYYRVPGGALTQVSTASNFVMTYGVHGVRLGFQNTGISYNGRMGAVSAYTFSSADFSDVVYPTDVVDPVTGLTWYVNPVTGSDSNSGSDTAHAWQTVSKLNAESANCGLFASDSYTTGDTLIIDTSAGNFDLGGTPITLQTAGLNVRAAAGQIWAVIQPWKTISAGSWTATGTTNVYSTTDATALACLWENDKWLTHTDGANFAAVSAALGSTAGSFYVDASGPTIYVHPFGNTDPRSDGKTYTRSYAGITTGAVNLNAANMDVWDLYVRKTCDVNASTAAPNAGYGISTGGTWSGTNRIKHCYIDYGGKHGLGLVANSLSNEVTVIDNVQSEQGSPYGSQSPFVSYNSNSTSATGIRHIYQNCTSLKDTGLIGSTAGTHGQNSTLLAHNNGTGTQFANFTVLNCNFGGGDLTLGVTESTTITGTTIGSITVNDPASTITRCLINRAGISQDYSTSPVLIVRNCIFTPTADAATLFSGTQGTSTWEGNTFDMSGATGADTQAGLFKRLAASTITFRNNAVLVPPAKSYTIFQAYVNTDTFTVTNNAYILGKNTQVAFQYNDGSTTAARTFAQWQALGFDANSVNATGLGLTASYRPLRGSPLINTGASLGSMVDYTGTIFSPRNDIGAIEFVPYNASVIRRGGRRF